MSFSIVQTLTDIKDAITNKASLQTEITNLQTELAAIKSNIAGLPDYATVLGQINTSLANIAGIGAVADLDVNDLSATLARVNETLSLGTLTVGGDIVLTDAAGGVQSGLDFGLFAFPVSSPKTLNLDFYYKFAIGGGFVLPGITTTTLMTVPGAAAYTSRATLLKMHGIVRKTGGSAIQPFDTYMVYVPTRTLYRSFVVIPPIVGPSFLIGTDFSIATSGNDVVVTFNNRDSSAVTMTAIAEVYA